ncbi:MAG: flavodoxin [Myxococcota bacterium]
MTQAITIFYGSTTGNTEKCARMIHERLGVPSTLKDIVDAELEDFTTPDIIIIGASTWNIGDLQDDWDNFLPRMEGLDLTGKKIAMFGLGDAEFYPDNFLDALGLIWDVVKELGAPELVGVWPTEDYEFTESVGLYDGDHFLGLGLDEDNEPERHEQRIDAWLTKVRAELGLPAAGQDAAE